MPTYDFTHTEQDVIRTLGRAGFRYIRETKKAIVFKSNTDEVITLNRELTSAIGLVFEHSKFAKYKSRIGSESVKMRSSSNFSELPHMYTKNSRENHTGVQVQFTSISRIQELVGETGASPC